MRRIVSILLVFTILTMISSPAALAQEIGGQTAEEAAEKKLDTEVTFDSTEEGGQTWIACHAKGKDDGQSIGTGGSAAGGFVGGVLLGLIGTGIAVLAQSKPDPSANQLMALEDESEECRYTYLESFRNSAHSKKKKAALTGGLIGTAIIVGVLLASNGS